MCYAPGKAARKAYDVFGNRIDLVSGTGGWRCMSQELGEFLFFCLWYSFYGMFGWALAALIFRILTPAAFHRKYFATPYFRSGEVMMLSGFPLMFVRTAMFIRLLASPSSGKVRGLDNAYMDAPVWLIAYAKFLYVTLILVLIWMFGMLAFWGGYLTYMEWLF